MVFSRVVRAGTLVFVPGKYHFTTIAMAVPMPVLWYLRTHRRASRQVPDMQGILVSVLWITLWIRLGKTALILGRAAVLQSGIQPEFMIYIYVNQWLGGFYG
jgi:hypothetical protein